MAHPIAILGLWTPSAGTTARVGYSRRSRTDSAALGSYVQEKIVLAELRADAALWFAGGTRLAMPRFDCLAIMAIVVVVINLPVLGRVFWRIRVIGRDFSH